MDIFGNTDEQMFRKIGYFDDQTGIMRRFQRESEHWDAHLRNTRQFVIEAMQDKSRKSAAVLGSGWLLDVPLKEMSRYFERLYLFDVRHPAEIKKQVASMGNVELCVCDISGYASPVYQYAKQYRYRKKRPPIDTLSPQPTLNLNDFDFVVSCNILNQLDILLIDYLAQFFELSHEETINFCSNVQHHHINILPQNRSCLVADYEEITLMPDGREISRKTSVHHPIIQQPDVKSWTWEFDTKMTYNKDRMTYFNVIAVK